MASRAVSPLFAITGHALIKDIWLNISNFTLTFQISKFISMDLYEISERDRPLGPEYRSFRPVIDQISQANSACKQFKVGKIMAGSSRTGLSQALEQAFVTFAGSSYSTEH